MVSHNEWNNIVLCILASLMTEGRISDKHETKCKLTVPVILFASHISVSRE